MNHESSTAERIFKWGAIAAAAVFCLGLALPILPVPVEFCGLVLFGWIGYLLRIPGEITFNFEVVGGSLVALGVGTWALHRLLRWGMRRNVDPVAKWRSAWTWRLTVLVLALFAASIGIGCIVHQIAWLCEEPQLIEMKGMGKQTREMSDLKQVATAITLYALDHQDRFPVSLDELVPDYLPTHKLLFTFAIVDDPPQRIIYYPGYKDTDSKGLIVLAAPRPFGQGTNARRTVVYLDTSATLLREAKFQKAIQGQQASGPVQSPQAGAASGKVDGWEARHE